eukprot:UN3192
MSRSLTGLPPPARVDVENQFGTHHGDSKLRDCWHSASPGVHVGSMTEVFRSWSTPWLEIPPNTPNRHRMMLLVSARPEQLIGPSQHAAKDCSANWPRRQKTRTAQFTVKAARIELTRATQLKDVGSVPHVQTSPASAALYTRGCRGRSGNILSDSQGP